MSGTENPMLSEKCLEAGSDSPMSQEHQEEQQEGAKQPRLKTAHPDKQRFVIKKFRRDDEPVKLDELGKRIKSLAEDNQKRPLEFDSDDSFDSNICKRLKQESNNLSVKPAFKIPYKTNDGLAVTPVLLSSKKDKRVFPCFDDKVVFRTNDELEFSNLLRKHHADNDAETSSEGLSAGKKRVMSSLLASVALFKKSLTSKLTTVEKNLRRGASNTTAHRSTTPSRLAGPVPGPKRSKSAIKG